MEELQAMFTYFKQGQVLGKKKNKTKIQSFLLKYPLFTVIYHKKGPNNFSQIGKKIKMVEYGFGQFLYKDENDRCFKYIIEGSVLLFVQKADDPNSPPLFFKKIGLNEHFGEKLIYNGTQKLHSAKAISKIYSLELDLETFYKTFAGAFLYEELKDKVQFLATLWVFKQIRECEIERILLLSKPFKYIKNTLLLRQGQHPQAVYVIIEGELTLMKKQSQEGKLKSIVILGKGQICAWEEVLQNKIVQCSVIVTSSSAVLLKINRQLFLDIFKNKISCFMLQQSNEIKKDLIERKSRNSLTMSLQKLNQAKPATTSNKALKYKTPRYKEQGQFYEKKKNIEVFSINKDVSKQVKLKNKTLREYTLSQIKDSQRKKYKMMRISTQTNGSFTNDKELLLQYLVRKERKQIIADQKQSAFRQTTFHVIPQLKIERSSAVKNQKRKLKQSRRSVMSMHNLYPA